MFSRPLSRTLLCVTLSTLSLPTFADTVWLKNGDRLTGKISVLDGGKLLIETEYGGSIPVKWSQVATLESNQQLLVKEGDASGEVAKSLQAADDGMVTLSNGGAPRTVPLKSITQIIHPKPLIQDLTWKGNVDVALDYKRAETDTDDYDISFKTSARHGLWRHNGSGAYNREYRDGVTATDNWEAEYALDRFLDEHWFWQGRLEYKRDKIEDVRRQRTGKCRRLSIRRGNGAALQGDRLGVAQHEGREGHRQRCGERAGRNPLQHRVRCGLVRLIA